MNQAEIQLETEKFMQALAMAISDEINKRFTGMGFALIVFKFNKPGVSNYISNAERSTMIEALKETATRLESKEDIPAAIGQVQ